MVLITGATSQLGEVLVKKLVERNENVRCFVRADSKIEKLKYENVDFAYGDFNDIPSINKAVKDIDYLIHIGGIWHAEKFLMELDRENVNLKKAIFVGSTSRFQKVNSKDPKEINLVTGMTNAEELINNSKQKTIIIRPTMLYGLDKDKNIYTLIKFMNKYRVFPIIGEGTGLKQPVHVYDVADAVLTSMYKEDLCKNEYNIPGASPVEYNEMIQQIKRNLGKSVFVFHIPITLARIGFYLFKKLRPNTFLNIEMINRVNKSYTFEYTNAQKDFNYQPMSFQDGVKTQIEYLKKVGKI